MSDTPPRRKPRTDLDPERVVVAAVGETSAAFVAELLLLFSTLQSLGGALTRARKIAYLVGDDYDGAASVLESRGIATQHAEPFDARCPHANKIRMFRPVENADFLVALDTDIAVARDFSAWIGGTAVAAKPVDQNPFSDADWRLLYDTFDIVPPAARFTAHFTAEETPPYFNSGVIIAPMGLVGPLAALWSDTLLALLDRFGAMPETITRHRFFADQLAFALALLASGVAYKPLPLAMNFPTHRPIHRSFAPHRVRPYLLHHHHRLSPSGDVLPTGYRQPDAAIARVNARRYRGGTR